MEEENVQAQDVEVSEESSQEEDLDLAPEDEVESEEETITLKKSDYNKMNRKAIAYDSNKKPKVKEKTALTEQKTESDTESIIKTVSALRGIEDDEIERLESEAQSLGVPLIKYIRSESGKSVLDKIRKDKKSKDASETVSTKAPVFKKHTMDDLGKMSSKDLEKILPKD